MARTFTQLHYHFVWTTHLRIDLITPEVERVLFPMLATKCHEIGLKSLAINGMPDHIHILLTVRPTIAPSEIAHQLKGSSSHYLNKKGHGTFAWQAGYGAFTVSRVNLHLVEAYIQRQKQHHAEGNLIRKLEEYWLYGDD